MSILSRNGNSKSSLYYESYFMNVFKNMFINKALIVEGMVALLKTYKHV